MSVKIRVSYTNEKELVEVLRKLSPAVRSYKVKEKRRHNLAYIEMKDMAKRPRFRTKNS